MILKYKLCSLYRNRTDRTLDLIKMIIILCSNPDCTTTSAPAFNNCTPVLTKMSIALLWMATADDGSTKGPNGIRDTCTLFRRPLKWTSLRSCHVRYSLFLVFESNVLLCLNIVLHRDETETGHGVGAQPRRKSSPLVHNMRCRSGYRVFVRTRGNVYNVPN